MLDPKLPDYDCSLLIRTDFSSDAAWQEICALLQAPQAPYGFAANLECISDRSCEGLEAGAVGAMLPPDSARTFVFLFDRNDAEHSVLVVDLAGEPGRSFRLTPAVAWAVENNLRLANMDFEDFAGACASDSVLRALPG
jgi:hypothetical protein